MNTNSLTRIIISCLIGAASCSSAMAQKLASGAVAIDNLKTHVEGNKVDVAFSLNLNNLKLKSEQQLVFTPMLVADGDTTALTPIIINGRAKQIRMERSGELAAMANEAQQPLVIQRKNGTEQSVSYSQTITRKRPFETEHLSLLTAQDLCGCGDNLANKQYELMEYRRPTAKFVRPEVVAEKIRELDKRAYIDFPVNRTELNPLYRRNPEQLDSIIKTINTLKEDKNLTVLAVNIHGFASPEGHFDNNDRLAKERAQTLTQYVQRMVRLDEGIFTVSYTAEDWDGLRKFIAESNMEHKQQILDLANDTSLKEDEREAKIKAVYPDEYRFLLTACYPALRHSDYHIKYKVRPFNVEEAKALVKTRPQLLSQNEMYMVAQTYEPCSKEFGEIMEIAVRMYPDDPTANLNAACTRLNAGDAEGAKPYLDKAGDSEEAKAALKVYEEIK